MSPRTPNKSSPRPFLSTAYDGNQLWRTLGQPTLPPLPSPTVSEHPGDNRADMLQLLHRHREERVGIFSVRSEFHDRSCGVIRSSISRYT